MMMFVTSVSKAKHADHHNPQKLISRLKSTARKFIPKESPGYPHLLVMLTQ